MIANLKHAARNQQTVTIGGGDFGPAELLAAATALESAEALLDALHIALPFVEDHEGSVEYKAGAVSKALATIRGAIAKAAG